jgi:hypothetical protein
LTTGTERRFVYHQHLLFVIAKLAFDSKYADMQCAIVTSSPGPINNNLVFIKPAYTVKTTPFME